jgi:hypothetical protein
MCVKYNNTLWSIIQNDIPALITELQHVSNNLKHPRSNFDSQVNITVGHAPHAFWGFKLPERFSMAIKFCFALQRIS